jgi:hypothetical protein
MCERVGNLITVPFIFEGADINAVTTATPKSGTPGPLRHLGTSTDALNHNEYKQSSC